MGIADSIYCALGRDPCSCCVMDVAGKLPKGIGGDAHNRLCPAHDDREASLSINPGKQVRLVWNCQAGCDPADVRSALLAAGIDDSCLGRYGTPKRTVVPGMRVSSYDPALVADAKRWQAALKLPPELSGKLLRMCLQAISEGDGDLPGDPARLLPASQAEFVALACRAGIEREYRYRLYKQWARSDAA